MEYLKARRLEDSIVETVVRNLGYANIRARIHLKKITELCPQSTKAFSHQSQKRKPFILYLVK